MNHELVKELIKRQHNTGPGMYLYHGRDNPDEQMDDWGFDGPTFGPLDWCHITYNSTINLSFTDGFCTDVMTRSDPLHFHGGMLCYDGKYYGDWALEITKPKN